MNMSVSSPLTLAEAEVQAVPSDSGSADAILKLYEGSLRALDTKAQIFLAFLAITMTPVFARFEVMDMAAGVKMLVGACVALATFSFIFCLVPRRGRRSQNGIFEIHVTGSEVAARLRGPEVVFDPFQTIAVLHDIYRQKSRSVTVGTWLVAIYILTAAAGFSLG